MSTISTSFRPSVYPYVRDAPTAVARIRVSAEDFKVEELPGFDPDGVENHLLLQVRKRERNTHDVVKWLSERTGAPRRDIGFCGLKDRVAVTTQWFSVPLEGNPTVPQGVSDGIEVIATARHSKKLRRGQHQGNRFEINLRGVNAPLPYEEIRGRFHDACRAGVPNYFGPQRFGRDGENIRDGLAMMKGEFRPRQAHIKGILLSALRSFLFNEILAARVEQGCWNRPLAGDIFLSGVDGSPVEVSADDSELLERCASFDLHPGGALPGPGDSGARMDAAALEDRVLNQHSEISDILAERGPATDRRSLRLRPASASIDCNDDSSICVRFDLPRGSFATSLLREIVNDAALGLPWWSATAQSKSVP